MGAVGQAVQMK